MEKDFPKFYEFAFFSSLFYPRGRIQAMNHWSPEETTKETTNETTEDTPESDKQDKEGDLYFDSISKRSAGLPAASPMACHSMAMTL